MKTSKNNLRLHRKKRVRAKISKGVSKIRLTVFRSLKGFYAQAIDDQTGRTMAFCSLTELKAKNDIKGASLVGKAIAEKCQAEKITEVVFDRSGYKYHGKVKAFADGAREAGLKF